MIRKLETSVRYLCIVVVLLIAISQPVVAPPSDGGSSDGGSSDGGSATDFANSICQSTGYKILLGILYVIVTLAFAALIAGGLAGAGLLSIGWVSRTLGQTAKNMVTGSIGGGIAMLLIITILGIVITNVSFNLPSSCTWVLG